MNQTNQNKFHIITALVIILLISLNSFAVEEIKIKSVIDNVTVYKQGAQIQRKSSYALSKDVNEIIIEGISPKINQNSIQVSATGNIILLDTKFTTEYPYQVFFTITIKKHLTRSKKK